MQAIGELLHGETVSLSTGICGRPIVDPSSSRKSPSQLMHTNLNLLVKIDLDRDY